MLAEFKKRQAQIRPAAEAMLAKAEDIAAGKAEYATYEDVFGTEDWFMLPVRFDPPAAKYIKKLKDKKLKKLYQEAIDKIREDYTIGETKTGDLIGFYGYDIYYNKTNYELAYTIERIDGELVVVVMAGTRENFYDELKRYIKRWLWPQWGQVLKMEEGY